MADTGRTPKIFDLNERIVVVTGALGQLGREFTRSLHESGCRVAALDLHAGDDERRAAFGAQADSPRLMLLQADVTSRESLEAALDRIEQEWGTPTGLVNNAGLDSPPDASGLENGPFETYPDASWDRVMEVNSKGVNGIG